jgi:hypothetical protein
LGIRGQVTIAMIKETNILDRIPFHGRVLEVGMVPIFLMMEGAMVKGILMPMIGMGMTGLTNMIPSPCIMADRLMAVAHPLPKKMIEPLLLLCKKKSGIEDKDIM